MHQGVLNGNAEGIQSYRKDGKQVHGKEAVDQRHHLTLNIELPHGLILDGNIEDRHDKTRDKQRPSKHTE